MCGLGTALEKTGYFPFIAAGLRVDDDGMPRLRLSSNALIVRRLSDKSWAIMRNTLVQAIDKMRSAPLDDLTRYEEV